MVCRLVYETVSERTIMPTLKPPAVIRLVVRARFSHVFANPQSVCLVDRHQQQPPAGLLLNAREQETAIDRRRRRSAAAAPVVLGTARGPQYDAQQQRGQRMLTADVGGRTQSRRKCTYCVAWLGSRVVSVLDSGAEEPGFKSQSRRCRVTVLGKLFTPIVPLFAKQRNWWQPA